MNTTPAISLEQAGQERLAQEFQARSEIIWDELREQCQKDGGKLPFVGIDPSDPSNITWNATSSGDELEDATRGMFCAEALIFRAKNWRGAGDPFQAIAEICMAIASKESPGAVEFGFFSRLAMLAMAASLN
jgi:hypothetical protein